MEHTTASKHTRTPATLAPLADMGSLDMRSQRARLERMAVTPLGGGVYDIESQSGHTYSVDLSGGRCTCPDHVFRQAHCKHIRRVAMEITEGLLPAPGEKAVACANCGKELFVDENAEEPQFCEACALAPGETVLDRETGDLLVVVRMSGRRADEVEITGRNCTVAEYPNNEGYNPDDVVVEVLYPIPAGLSEDELKPHHLRRYSFPRGRLGRRGEASTEQFPDDQSELGDFRVEAQ
ncbi:SWIM zinc finger family protein [Halorussus halophilus]|uniref:SWIM zinc finger family protein n=1 Tax=Halorussus halophilus TaxID=2650975 RepID=UPI001CE3FF97|nr:SWIM zinc finger family protein [Halorussus halophilus]